MRPISLFLLLLLVYFKPATLSAQKTLLPDIALVQYAGNIGMFSLGIGYQNKSKKLELEFLTGYLPARYSHRAHVSLAVKGNYYPWHVQLTEDIRWAPLGPGLMASYTFGDEYFLTPDRYPKGYYTFSTAAHAYLLAGGYIEHSLCNKQLIKRIGLFYSWNLSAEELFSLVQNTRQLDLDDVLSLGLGLRFSF